MTHVILILLITVAVIIGLECVKIVLFSFLYVLMVKFLSSFL